MMQVDNSSVTKKLTLAMIEDVQDIRKNVLKYIGMHDEFDIKESFGSVESFLTHYKNHHQEQINILLLDIGLPGISGIEGIPKILELFPDVDIIMLTTYEEEEVILKAICAGACSYISKKASLTQIVDAVRIVAKGGSYMSPSVAREIVQHLMSGNLKPKQNSLTERQNQILKYLSEGKSYRDISIELSISIETVRTHVKKLYKQLHVSNKAEAISLYLKGKIK